MRAILSILLSSLKPEARVVRSILIRIAVLFFALCISSVVAALGLGFVVWSLYLYLQTLFTPYVAALISGGAAVAVALLLVLVAVLFTGRFKGRGGAGVTPLLPLDGRLPDSAEAFIKQYPLESGLIAAAAGFIAGSSPDTPRTLTELISLLKESASE